MNKSLKRMLGLVKPGDLVCVEWFDASRGIIQTINTNMLHGMGAGKAVPVVDSPVQSFGIFIGIFGARQKHIVLVASMWRHTSNYEQVDTIIIPTGTIDTVRTIAAGVMDLGDVKLCQVAFVNERCHHFRKRIIILGKGPAEAV